MPLFYIRKTVKSEGKVHGIFYKPKYKIPHDKITAMEKQFIRLQIVSSETLIMMEGMKNSARRLTNITSRSDE